MKKLTVLFILNINFLVYSQICSAMSFEVIGKNARSLYRQILVGDFKEKSVLDFTLEALSSAQDRGFLTYIANKDSVISVNALGSDIKVISDTELKAYGWCYTVNGRISEDYPNQAYLKSGTDKIVWYYGYALYKNGIWVGQCIPAWQ